MITREQVADLQVGDVVEMTDDAWQGASMRGPLVTTRAGSLVIGVTSATYPTVKYIVRQKNGDPSDHAYRRTLTVISRVPRSTFTNYPRSTLVKGDVARDAAGMNWVWDSYSGISGWYSPTQGVRGTPTGDLELLINGATGEPPFSTLTSR